MLLILNKLWSNFARPVANRCLKNYHL